ncbi:phosphoenolpyruvate carboxylase, partial [Sphingomonas bacterium]|uniref:phosphoenolpyruvate carboxylase n=1 Tax=Sphingomonas bacterium TaxID=1895847 RepID=UPI0015757889
MTSAPSLANNADIRYLGTLLGDVIRGYGGEELFAATEAIRRASVERHRAEDVEAEGHPAELGIERLDLDATLDFVRGFMLFSMLANLAEDRQGYGQGLAAEPGADVAAAIERLGEAGVDKPAILRLLDHALVAPVLTAHPTEVRRKSMIDHRNRIAELMGLRDAGHEHTPDGDRVEDAIVRQIALLWQTRVLRRERLVVTDEVDTALFYLRDVFVPALPALYQRWDRALGERVPSFLRPGSWIGGDRDGNPFVTADSLRTAIAKASAAILASHAEALHALGGELSISARHVAVDPAVLALAEA